MFGIMEWGVWTRGCTARLGPDHGELWMLIWGVETCFFKLWGTSKGWNRIIIRFIPEWTCSPSHQQRCGGATGVVTPLCFCSSSWKRASCVARTSHKRIGGSCQNIWVLGTLERLWQSWELSSHYPHQGLEPESLASNPSVELWAHLWERCFRFSVFVLIPLRSCQRCKGPPHSILPSSAPPGELLSFRWSAKQPCFLPSPPLLTLIFWKGTQMLIK